MRLVSNAALFCLSLSLPIAGCASTPTKDDEHAHSDEHHHEGHGDKAGSHKPMMSDDEHKHAHKHGHHRFDDPKKWAERFEDPARDGWQKPDVVLAALELSPQSVVADVGSATGYFPVRIAPLAKKVYGVDIEQSMVDYLNERAAREGLTNLTSVLGTATSAALPEEVDVVLMVNTYHHIEQRVAYFNDLQVKEGGRVVIVDFKTEGDTSFGPPANMRLATDVVLDELSKAGFTHVRTDAESLPHQYIVVVEKKAPAPVAGADG